MPTLTKSKPQAAADTSKPAPRRRDDDDDEIESSRLNRRPARAEEDDDADDGDIGAAGWGGGESVATPSGFAANLKLDKGETAVFKFLEDAPYINLRVHWVERKGKRSFICSQKPDCPLCVAGADVQSEHRFNIALFTEDEPVLRSLNVSYGHFNEFKDYGTGPSGPLPKRIYTRTRPSKAGGRYKHTQLRYPEDVAEDFPALHVPTKEELQALVDEGLYDVDAVKKERSSRQELAKIAAELTGDGDYDDED